MSPGPLRWAVPSNAEPMMSWRLTDGGAAERVMSAGPEGVRIAEPMMSSERQQGRIAVGAERPRRPARRAGSPGNIAVAGRRGLLFAWIAASAIPISLLIMIGAGLVRSSWTSPALVMPGFGPPWEIQGLRVPVQVVTIALWLAAILAGIGVTAGLMAVPRGLEVSRRVVFAAGLMCVALLAVVPPVGSSDALDYVAYGRMVEVGRTPYVMTPAHLKADYPAYGQSVPLECDHPMPVY